MSWFQMVLGKLKIAKNSKCLQALREERGAIFVLTALMLPVLLGCLGFAYDAGNLYIHKARLQNTADAAALAGGRAYVNALGEYASNGVLTTVTEDQKAEAKGALKSSAQQYIGANNPLFAAKTGKEEKFYFGTRSTSVGEKTNSTEYFRVNLTEPVQLYFLPVIGIQKSVDVKAYATTKLTDTVVSSGGNNQQADAENKPVVIAGSSFYDESNTDDPSHVYNYYNVSNVYVKTGGTSNVLTKDGKKVVPSSSGTIHGQAYDGTGNFVDVTYAEVEEVDYDMMAYGEEIRKLFRQKQKEHLSESDKQKYAEYEAKKAQWDQGYANYLNAYNAWIASGTPQYSSPSSKEEMIEIYNLIVKYNQQCAPWQAQQNTDAYTQVLQQWNSDGRPLVGSESDFKQVMSSNALYNLTGIEPKDDNWSSLKEQEPYIVNGIRLGIMKINGTKAPEISTYTGLEKEPNIYADYGIDEYYMTYHAYNDQIQSYSTNTISSDTSLSGSEHSYCYLSHASFLPNPGAQTVKSSINVLVDGFYEGDGITNNTPFYLFIEDDIQLENIWINNTNRPLILCYMGSYQIHYEMQSGPDEANRNVIRGFFYNPNAAGDTHQNGSHIDFKGSIVAEKLTIHGKQISFTYDVDEVKRWQDEGLPVTPNIGFSSSAGGGEGSGAESVKITLIDRLRLFLAGNSNQNNYYNPDDGAWNWTSL